MGIGDWGLGIGPNPQSPITFFIFKKNNFFYFIILIKILNNIFYKCNIIYLMQY